MHFGTLFFFNIDHTSSKTTTQSFLKTHADWDTVYYNNGRPVGTSKTTTTSFETTRHADWSTIYYDLNKKIVGSSRTQNYANEACTHGFWKTTYYDVHRQEVGSSTSSTTSSHEFITHANWETTYFSSRGEKFGTSKTKPQSQSCIHAEWHASYEPQEVPEFLKVEISSRTDAQNAIKEKTAQIASFKKYYLSKSNRFFNASESIFTGNNPEEVLNKLAYRAKQNPRGASDKTFQRFNPNRDVKKEKEDAAQICKFKDFYKSIAGPFNASNKIFKDNNLDEILQTLRSRAKKKPGGASEQTLKKFNLPLVQGSIRTERDSLELIILRP